jgi:hypothetical protein
MNRTKIQDLCDIILITLILYLSFYTTDEYKFKMAVSYYLVNLICKYGKGSKTKLESIYVLVYDYTYIFVVFQTILSVFLEEYMIWILSIYASRYIVITFWGFLHYFIGDKFTCIVLIIVKLVGENLINRQLHNIVLSGFILHLFSNLSIFLFLKVIRNTTGLKEEFERRIREERLKDILEKIFIR